MLLRGTQPLVVCPARSLDGIGLDVRAAVGLEPRQLNQLVRLGGAARARVAAGALLPEDVDVTLDLVERALRAHVGVV